MTKSLLQVLNGIQYRIVGVLPAEITEISFDTRSLANGSLYIAVRGQNLDGHNFLQDAVAKGAAVAMVEEVRDELPIPQIVVADSKAALSRAAANFFDNSSTKLKVVGITGTNGKTTITTLLKNILLTAQKGVGTIGTLGYSIDRFEQSLNLTTPDSLTLQRLLHEMVRKNVEYVIMEVSSHSLALKRVEDIHFSAAAFTNISQDHLDFHKTLDDYARTKTLLFGKVDPLGFLVCNRDDVYADWFVRAANAPVLTFSLEGTADFSWSGATQFTNGINGRIQSPHGLIEIQSALSGKFNMQNILAAVAVASRLGIQPAVISAAFRTIRFIPGRLQEITRPGYARLFVDYAHTPDAIRNALSALREITNPEGRLIALFGCGGNRDRNKRPKMARAVDDLADFAVLTTDNPRFEKPSDIISDAVPGFTGRIPHQIIEDRKEAIYWVIDHATDKDVVALLGKGHETYQEIAGKRYPFDEVQIVKEFLDQKK